MQLGPHKGHAGYRRRSPPVTCSHICQQRLCWASAQLQHRPAPAAVWAPLQPVQRPVAVPACLPASAWSAAAAAVVVPVPVCRRAARATATAQAGPRAAPAAAAAGPASQRTASVSLHAASSRAARSRAASATASAGQRPVRCAAAATVAAPTQYKKAKLAQDYAAVASDADVLRRPLKDQLTPQDVKNVFDYPRDVREWCAQILLLLLGPTAAQTACGGCRCYQLALHAEPLCCACPRTQP